jgi:hypothetical protein
MDVALAAELFGRGDLVDRIELAPRAGVDAQALRLRAAELLPADVTVAPPSRRRAPAAPMVAALRCNLIALSAISVLVGAVLVATTLATSVVQRRYTVACCARSAPRAARSRARCCSRPPRSASPAG